MVGRVRRPRADAVDGLADGVVRPLVAVVAVLLLGLSATGVLSASWRSRVAAEADRRYDEAVLDIADRLELESRRHRAVLDSAQQVLGDAPNPETDRRMAALMDDLAEQRLPGLLGVGVVDGSGQLLRSWTSGHDRLVAAVVEAVTSEGAGLAPTLTASPPIPVEGRGSLLGLSIARDGSGVFPPRGVVVVIDPTSVVTQAVRRHTEAVVVVTDRAVADGVVARSGEHPVDGSPVITRGIPVVDRLWLVEFAPAEGGDSRAEDGMPRIVAVAGSAFTVALALLVWTLIRGRGRAVALVARRTAELRSSEARFRGFASASPVGIFEVDAHDRTTYVNARMCELLAATEEVLLGRQLMSHVDDRDAIRVDEGWRSAVERGAEHADRFRVRDAQGAVHVVNVNLVPLSEGGWLGVLVDVTAEAQAERARAMLADVIQATPDLVGTMTVDGRLRYLNPAGRAALRLADEADLSGVVPRELFADSSWRRVAAEALPTASAEGSWSGQLELRRPDGRLVPVSLVLVAHAGDEEGLWFSAVIRDRSAEQALEDRLADEARHDPLTGLLNRSACLAELGRRLGAVDAEPVGACFIDLDAFKRINDTLGHEGGDKLLVELARRLRQVTRPDDLVGRLGGDEFLVLCTGFDVDAAESFAERMRVELARPYLLDGMEVVVSASIGVDIASPGQDPDALVRHADQAMYRAKAAGRNRIQRYRAEQQRRTSLDLEQRLRHAVDRGELELHYQPLLTVAGEHLAGVEALLRWRRGGEVIAPGAFLPVAEAIGLILPIGLWTVEQAVSDLARWRRLHGAAAPFVTLNVSPRQLLDPLLAPTLLGAVAAHGVPASEVVVEVTEHGLLADVEVVGAALRELRGAGVRIALDDFGTGGSSLAHLRRFPVDMLKVDRQFIEGLEATAEDRAIVAGVLQMAAGMGLETVAEGAARGPMVEALAALRCDYLQGFDFARPTPVATIDRLLDPTAGAAVA